MELPIVLVKNLPYDASTPSLLGLFKKYGPVDQLRISDGSAPAGTCFVIYTNMDDAKKAASELNGINFQNRYLISSVYRVDAGVAEAAFAEQKAAFEAAQRERIEGAQEGVSEKKEE